MSYEYKYSASDYIAHSGRSKDQYSELIKERKISETKKRSILRLEEVDDDFMKNNKTGRNKVFCKHHMFYMYMYKDFIASGFPPNYFTTTLSVLKRYSEKVFEQNSKFSLIGQIYKPDIKLKESVIRVDISKMSSKTKERYGEQQLNGIEEYLNFRKLYQKNEQTFQLGWTLERFSTVHGDWIQPNVVEYCFVKKNNQIIVKEARLFPNKGREKIEGEKWGEQRPAKKSGIHLEYIPTHSIHTKIYTRLDITEVLREFLIKFNKL